LPRFGAGHAGERAGPTIGLAEAMMSPVRVLAVTAAWVTGAPSNVGDRDDTTVAVSRVDRGSVT
jgi:hypothetical protein